MWSTGDADTPGDWAFTEPYYVSLLKICDAWSQAFTGARVAAYLTVQLEGFDEESEEKTAASSITLNADNHSFIDAELFQSTISKTSAKSSEAIKR